MEAASNPKTSELWSWCLLIWENSKPEGEGEGKRLFLNINLDATASLYGSSARWKMTPIFPMKFDLE